MPRRDRTGPMGEGPMTGWGYGHCSGNPTPVHGGLGFSRGYGRGYGRGSRWGGGWRNRFRAADIPGWASYGPAWPTAAPLTPEQETDILKAQAKDMEETLGQINQRLKELEKEKK
jgi:hypothetical protein